MVYAIKEITSLQTTRVSVVLLELTKFFTRNNVFTHKNSMKCTLVCTFISMMLSVTERRLFHKSLTTCTSACYMCSVLAGPTPPPALSPLQTFRCLARVVQLFPHLPSEPKSAPSHEDPLSSSQNAKANEAAPLLNAKLVHYFFKSQNKVYFCRG